MKQIGRYEIARELGRGAMGVVYAAVDPLIGRPVAIKTIRLGALEAEAGHAELKLRLRREAQAAGVLSHSGIITIYDIGEQGEDAYIVMEFIDGKTVEEMLVSGEIQHSGTFLSILSKTADALDYAHARGIIHRDIKPSNIMVCANGAVKIADFGVAKLAASNSMTQSGFVLGTPSYMSPEQAQGRTLDGRSDQFSLAVVAYRMLTGKLPFEGPTLTALLSKILWEEPEYESAGLKPPVRPVFEKALKKDPQLRYRDCAEFACELVAAYTEAEIAMSGTRRSTVKSEPTQVNDNAIRPETIAGGNGKGTSLEFGPAESEISARRAKNKSSIRIGIAALGVVLLAAIVFFAFKAMKAPAPAIQPLSSEARTISGDETEKVAPPVEPLNPAQISAPPETSPAASGQTVLKSESVAAAAIPKPKPVATPAPATLPESGTVTWSGNLEKNSILVIAEQGASIGMIKGQLPGKPVRIEVEPEGLLVRQKPGEINGWRQIILYSGNRKYTSISIHWKFVK